MGEMAKVMVKLYMGNTNTYEWRHLCYVSKELFDSYKENMSEEFNNMNKTLSRWVQEDFNKDLTITSQSELDLLKLYVKEYCKNIYPDVYLDTPTDRQGWMRVWVSKKMQEDLDERLNDGE